MKRETKSEISKLRKAVGQMEQGIHRMTAEITLRDRTIAEQAATIRRQEATIELLRGRPSRTESRLIKQP